MKNDSNKEFLLRTILFNNRLDSYESYLSYAVEHGYILTSFIDYLENPAYDNKKIMILRHDIDRSVEVARLMFLIEKRHRAKATYYFRWDTFDKQFIDELISAGFEVGLHYETLSAYCTKNSIQVVDKEILSICKEQLKREIQLFNEKTGAKIKTVCSHGSPENRQLHVSNNVLLEDENYKDFDIKCEAYDRSFYTKVDVHIMDADILNNYGFAYHSNPTKSIKDGKKLIVFLSHPAHWKLNHLQRMIRLVKFTLGMYTTNTTRVFKRIDISGLRDTKQEFASESVINLGN